MVKRILGCILITVIAAIFVFGTVVIVPSNDDMVIGSRLIIRAKVVENNTRHDNPNMSVFTYTMVKVLDIYKGQLNTDTLVIKEPGGIYFNSGSIIYGIPEFQPEEEVILFLDSWPDGSLRTYQWFLGKYEIRSNKIKRSDGRGVTFLDSLPNNAEDSNVFINNLKLRIAKLKKQSDSFESKYYSNIAINSFPRELNNPVQNFTFINPQTPLRWFEPDTGQSVIYRLNPANAPLGNATVNLQAALNAWGSVSGSGLRVTNGGNTNGCGLLTLDGENTVFFNNCDNYSPFSPPVNGCSGVLAAAGIISYNPSISKVVNGITFYRAIESNLSFNPYAACYFTDNCRIQEVMSHEMGHTLGLGHSLDSNATMYPYAHFDGRCANLQTDDMNGARFIYPSTTTPTPTPTPFPTPTPTPAPSNNYTLGDWDGDGLADPTVWNGSTGMWNILQSSTNTVRNIHWGAGYAPYYDVTCPYDFDNDRKTDAAVFRANGEWWILSSINNSYKKVDFGQNGDVPVVGRYRTNLTDIAVYRPSNGNWYILDSQNQQVKIVQLGGSGYIPVRVDMDGDGLRDIAVFRDGNWYYITSSDNTLRSATYGLYGDIPVPAYYESTTRTNLAVWRGSTGMWYILNFNGSTTSNHWGAGYSPYFDVPQPLNYLSSGIMELVVYRKLDFNWYIKNLSTNTFTIKNLGSSNSSIVNYY